MIEYAYAKINLTLRVINKRNDGFHNLESLIVPIDIYDILKFEESDIDLYSGPFIQDNNILKTLKLFKEKYNIKECVKITLEKNIPIMAGLAGGSSDSSAVLRGLNRFFKINAPLQELESLASIMGSDNVYALYQKPMLMEGRGEIVKSVDFKSEKNILIIKPSFGVSTKEIFMNYKESKGLKTDLNNLVMFNDLENITRTLYKELDDLFCKIESYGYEPHMSGSGPSIFVIDELEKLMELKDLMKNDNLYLKITNFLKN